MAGVPTGSSGLVLRNGLTVTAGDLLVASWAGSAAPPPDYTVSEWADAERVLPETSGARGARWRTDAVPYLRGIMNAIHEHGVSRIALRKASQIGGSESLHNIVGYLMHHNPSPMLFVHPTASVAEEWSKERLGDLIRTTPALREVVRAKRGKGDAESTLTLIMFPGGFLALGGANTPNTFARRAVRYAFGDDVDRFPPVVGDEGDPMDLLGNRTESFFDGVVFMVSTPTLKGGRIDTAFTRSDQRHYFLQCPSCSRWDRVTWNDAAHFRVTFDGHDPETARLECPDDNHGGCGAQLSEPERRAMVDLGEWRPTAVAQDAGLVGFHLPAMLSTIGSRTLAGLVEKWQSARSKGKESLRVFINTQLAEGWEERGTRMDAHVLMYRREAYGALLDGTPIEVPMAAPVLTAGVDVQDNRFELQVVAWGPAGENWVVDWRVVPGNPKTPETQGALLEALGRRYQHASGHALPILATCLDTGFATEEMYDFVLAYQVRRIYATKGFGGRSGSPIVGKPSEVRYGKRPRPVRLYPVNVDDAKGDIMASLALAEPGPGWTHFPIERDTIDDEYFAQLCAEHRETRYNKSGIATHTIWVQDRERNEALDTKVLALAAFKLQNPNIRQMAEALAAVPLETKPLNGAEPPPSAPVLPARRVGRSSYLNR